MLIRFVLENYLSFKGEAELSMIPSLVRRYPDHVIKNPSRSGMDVLKLAMVYGANASGKSNLVRGISDAQRFITMGAKPRGGFKSNVYKLDKKTRTSPTNFEFTILIGSTCYEYGFSYGSGKVCSEWLNIVTKESNKNVYKRTYSEANQSYDFDFSNLSFQSEEDKQFFAFTQKGTPEERLFLTECRNRGIEKNIPDLDSIIDVINWFSERLIVMFPHSTFSGLEFIVGESESSAKIFAEILKKFDVGIEKLKLIDADASEVLDEMPKEVRSRLLSDIKSSKGKSVTLFGDTDERYLLRLDEEGELIASKVAAMHLDSNGNQVNFDLNEESHGTRRLLDMLPGLLSMLASDRVVVIDELDSNMHPAITRSIVSSFLSVTAGVQSQLIVTTHDASLLDQDMIRKDEVWFAERARDNSSKLYSLEEFKDIRFDRDLNKSYIEGRFGGVPITSQLQKITFESHEE